MLAFLKMQLSRVLGAFATKLQQTRLKQVNPVVVKIQGRNKKDLSHKFHIFYSQHHKVRVAEMQESRGSSN